MNAIVKFWVRRIEAGRATIDDVPEYWREAVREALKKEGEDVTT